MFQGSPREGSRFGGVGGTTSPHDTTNRLVANDRSSLPRYKSVEQMDRDPF
jgi:hypothetical protein